MRVPAGCLCGFASFKNVVFKLDCLTQFDILVGKGDGTGFKVPALKKIKFSDYSLFTEFSGFDSSIDVPREMGFLPESPALLKKKGFYFKGT